MLYFSVICAPTSFSMVQNEPLSVRKNNGEGEVWPMKKGLISKHEGGLVLREPDQAGRVVEFYM